MEGQELQFDAVAFERGLTIEGEVEEGLHVQGDEMRLESAVKTILENACKYSEQPGTIALKLVRAKNQAVLTVHNGGDPIPSEDLPHLFDRFYRSDKARAHEGEAASLGWGSPLPSRRSRCTVGRLRRHRVPRARRSRSSCRWPNNRVSAERSFLRFGNIVRD